MSQPVDTQDCVSSNSPTQYSEATTQLPLGRSDQPESSRSTPSVFVQLRTSPRKRQSVDHSSALSEDQEMKDISVVAIDGSQSLFDSQSQEGGHREEDTQPMFGVVEEEKDSQRDEILIPPKHKKPRPSIESQDSQDSHVEKDASTSKLKQKVLPDGRVIHYAFIRYCDVSGKVIHTEYDEGVDSTQGSSGYAADHSCSGTSSGTSHNSQELILKAHRSAEDGLFLSPQVPILKKSNSLPRASADSKPTGLAPLPTNPSKVLVSQQRRSILAAVNGNKTRRGSGTKSTLQLSPITCNSTNISGVSAILSDDGLTHSHVQETNADTLPPSQSESPIAQEEKQVSNKTSQVSNKTSQVSTKTSQPGTGDDVQAQDRKSKLDISSILPTAPSQRNLRRRKRTKSSLSKADTAGRQAVKRARKVLSSNDSSSSSLPYGRSARNLPLPNHKELVVGARVIAKWPSDSYYYFGLVIQKDRGMWQIIYDDGNHARVSNKDLLVIQAIPKRHAVLARRPASDEYVSAIVVGNEEENQYIVSLINEAAADIRVSSKDICLDAGQFNNLSMLLASQQSSTTDVESNIDLSYGERHGVTLDNTVAIATTSTPVQQPAVLSAKKAKIYTDIQKSPVKGRTRKSGDAAATTCCALKFGESATTQLDVFSGFVFMVTSLHKDKLINEVMDRLGVEEDSQSQSQVDTADELDDTADIETISAKIEALGGLVIEKYDPDVVAAAKRCFLISSGFRRTLKYLQCLAANIPPLSHNWVEQCFREKRFVDEIQYLLPSGVNSQGSIVEWGHRTNTKPTPLKGVSVLLSTKEAGSAFLEDWSSILKVAGAIVVKKISVASGIKPDYIMTNAAGCSKTHQNQSKRLNIPVVGTEWAIQQLINGKMP